MKYLVILSTAVALASCAIIPDIIGDEGFQDLILNSSQVAEENTNQGQNEGISKEKLNWSPGIKFVDHNPFWSYISQLDNEELQAFMVEYQIQKENKKEEKLKAKEAKEKEKEEAKEQKLQDKENDKQENDLIKKLYQLDDADVVVNRKNGNQYGEFIPGLGYISYYSPFWIIINGMNSEQLDDFINQLHSNQQKQTQLENEIHMARKYNPLHVQYIPGLGVVSLYSPFGLYVSSLGSEELEDFLAQLHPEKPLNDEVSDDNEQLVSDTDETDIKENVIEEILSEEDDIVEQKDTGELKDDIIITESVNSK